MAEKNVVTKEMRVAFITILTQYELFAIYTPRGSIYTFIYLYACCIKNRQLITITSKLVSFKDNEVDAGYLHLATNDLNILDDLLISVLKPKKRTLFEVIKISFFDRENLEGCLKFHWRKFRGIAPGPADMLCLLYKISRGLEIDIHDIRYLHKRALEYIDLKGYSHLIKWKLFDASLYPGIYKN